MTTWECSACGQRFTAQAVAVAHIATHAHLSADTTDEPQSPRQCYFTVTGSARQICEYLDDEGRPIDWARGWPGHSLDEIMAEAARRVRLWEESTGQTAYRIEVTCLSAGKAKQ